MKSVKKTSVKKYQDGGAQPGSKKTYARRVSSKPISRGEAADRFKKIMAEKEKPPFQFNPKDSKKIMQSGGGQMSREEFEKRKAAYKKITGRDLESPKSFKPKEENQFYPSKMDRAYYDLQDAASNFMQPEYVFGKPTGMRNIGTMNRTVDSLNVQDKAYGRTTLPRNQYIKAENIVTKKQKGGATNVGKSTTTKKGSMAATAKKPLTPKAAYGMAVKPGMMKKGGTMKSKK